MTDCLGEEIGGNRLIDDVFGSTSRWWWVRDTPLIPLNGTNLVPNDDARRFVGWFAEDFDV